MKDIAEIIDILSSVFPNGHPDFIPMLVSNMDLHSRKNDTYARGGDPAGNFNRVSSIKQLYPGFDWTTPAGTCIDYMLKQFDSFMWQYAGKYEDDLEGLDARLKDVNVYSVLARILVKEEKEKSSDEFHIDKDGLIGHNDPWLSEDYV